MRRRLAAIGSLLLMAVAVGLAVAVAARDFPKGVPVVVCAVLAGIVAWRSLVRGRAVRTTGLVVAGLLVLAAGVLIVVNHRLLEDALLIGCVALAVALARAAFVVHSTLPQAERPTRPVLFWNPRSGGGKAMRFQVENEARRRGIEPIELKPGQDLEELVTAAIRDGADGLAMAGGDGSQAIVARLAATHDLPYACIPSGTRNHFALDLGVDRDDVVGALDAFVDGGERRVDLAEVNGRVFVNNVSLGLYADAVQQEGYREAKLRTLLDTLPSAVGAESANAPALSWRGPDGRTESAGAAILVSNNPYRLGRAVGSGTRPRVDTGELGVALFGAPGAGRPWRDWAVRRFEVSADHPVNAGIDGEAAVLDPPLRFVSRAGVLRARIARQHPGASPSAGIPPTAWGSVRQLARIAFGHVDNANPPQRSTS